MASLASDETVSWSKLDHALGTTLALTRVASGRGDRVTIIAFSIASSTSCPSAPELEAFGELMRSCTTCLRGWASRRTI
jgi:uncharacterized protein (DUF58 family)